MLQVINHTLGAVNTEKGKENPVPDPEYLPRPNEYAEEDEE